MEDDNSTDKKNIDDYYNMCTQVINLRKELKMRVQNNNNNNLQHQSFKARVINASGLSRDAVHLDEIAAIVKQWGNENDTVVLAYNNLGCKHITAHIGSTEDPTGPAIWMQDSSSRNGENYLALLKKEGHKLMGRFSKA